MCIYYIIYIYIRVAKIGNLDVEEFEIKKPLLPTITAATAVSDFVGPRSRLVFDLLEVPVNFLREEDWQLQPEYSTTKRILETFTPVNDSTERALALATNYNSKITRKSTGRSLPLRQKRIF